jgi:hypothetical protein
VAEVLGQVICEAGDHTMTRTTKATMPAVSAVANLPCE